MQIVFTIDETMDNDSVMEAAQRVLTSEGAHGWDDLCDSLNGAYNADMRVSRGADTLGRASLRSAYEMMEDDDGDWDEWKVLLLTGVLRRAVGLKML